jgi:hypothetical protein
MIATSKRRYRRAHPGSAAVFNANVVAGHSKIWFGDLDLALDECKLVELARRIDQSVAVLSEYDGRFRNEDSPRLERALYAVTPDGRVEHDPDELERGPDGRLRDRRRLP